ncbi:MAG: hypothetical protein JWN25_1612 [Verrucomicrobiales bacterium]|nr:hypothetical protein [Verrucomicrobiales bacterium]
MGSRKGDLQGFLVYWVLVGDDFGFRFGVWIGTFFCEACGAGWLHSAECSVRARCAEWFVL